VHRMTWENEIAMLVVSSALLLAGIVAVVVLSRQDTRNANSIDENTVLMELIEERTRDRFTAGDFDEFLKANPLLVDPRK
jgi:hypothetical protein